METNHLTIKDNRTGQEYQIPIYNNSFINAKDIMSITDTDGKILRSYDPGYTNTMNCTSSITFIDGGKGVL